MSEDADSFSGAALAIARCNVRVATRKETAEIQPLLDRLEELMNSDEPHAEIVAPARRIIAAIAKKGWGVGASAKQIVFGWNGTTHKVMRIHGDVVAHKIGEEFLVAYSAEARKRMRKVMQRINKAKEDGDAKGGAE